ncbi:hypothetical protein GCM10023081_05300 [Arthrobacter ginkgonis]|uniref:Uncharacterized protein n=1 Tax=Arthrobacter ginkgonis TaxID=1630594 RepID=A0ABP7BW54_9MICC
MVLLRQQLATDGILNFLPQVEIDVVVVSELLHKVPVLKTHLGRGPGGCRSGVTHVTPPAGVLIWVQANTLLPSPSSAAPRDTPREVTAGRPRRMRATRPRGKGA